MCHWFRVTIRFGEPLASGTFMSDLVIRHVICSSLLNVL